MYNAMVSNSKSPVARVNSISKPVLTMRQIEVLRAVMVCGTIAGAARLLNVSAPGLSRLVKYTEQTLGFHLFDRNQGRLVPTPQSHAIFEQINTVVCSVENLREFVRKNQNAQDSDFHIAAECNLSNVIIPRVVARLSEAYPDLRLSIDIVDPNEANEYLLVGKGDLVALCSPLSHADIIFEPQETGEMFCVVPATHPLTQQAAVSLREISRYPLIGVDRNDPSGRFVSNLFAALNLPYIVSIRATLSTTVFELIVSGAGIAIVNQFTLPYQRSQELKILRIAEPTHFPIGIATKLRGTSSPLVKKFTVLLREEAACSKRALQACPC